MAFLLSINRLTVQETRTISVVVHQEKEVVIPLQELTTKYARLQR